MLDDQSTIVDNQTIRTWWQPSSVLVPEPNTAIAGRPIVNLTFALNYAIGGLELAGYHIVNILIHILCALVAFGIVRRTFELPALRERFRGSAVGLAFAAILLWVVHPLNSEVVDYLTERTESLMAFFYLFTLYASIRAFNEGGQQVGIRAAGESAPPRRKGVPGSARREMPPKRDRVWTLTAIACCALGMACKESMVSAPLMVLLYDRVFLYDSFSQALKVRRTLYVGLAASWVVLVGLMLSGPRAAVGGFSTGVPLWTWLLNQCQMIAHYFRLVFWPRALVVFYGWPLSLTLTDVLPYAAMIVTALIATGVALLRWPRVGFLGAWVFITLAPTSSVIPIATEVGAERRMYLPLIAVSVLAVVGAVTMWQRLGLSDIVRLRGAVIGAIALTLTAVPLGAATALRNREYQSPLTLARTVVERRPSAVTRHYLAEQLVVAGRHEEALPYLRDAVAGGDSRAGYLLGIELFNAGKFDEAASQLNAFVRTSGLPYRLVPHWLEPPLVEVLTARLALARIASMQRRFADMADQVRLVLAAAPGNREARLFLADALFAQQQYAAAGPEYEKYLAARPNDAHALANLGITKIVAEKVDDAIELFRRAISVEPRNADWHRLLGLALMDRGDANGAAAQAREGLQLRPDDAALRELLARTQR